MKRWYAVFILVALLSPSILVNAQSMLPVGGHVRRQQAILIGSEGETITTAEYWNTRSNFIVEITLPENLYLKEAQVYAGLLPPELKNGKPIPGKFPCIREFSENTGKVMISCHLEDHFGFRWGGVRTRNVAIHGDLIELDANGVYNANNPYAMGKVKAIDSFWVVPVNESGLTDETIYTPFPRLRWGGYFKSTFYHPARGHFVDSPVSGLTYETPTNWDVTDVSGGFDYFPGERVNLWVGSVYLGSLVADHKISPLDIFMGYDTSTLEGNPVINMARLLQSLDADGEPQGGINITSSVITCLDTAVADLYYEDESVDFYNDLEVENLINQTLAHCEGVEGVTLVKASAEDAQGNLDKSLNSMFRKNISRTPDMPSSKSKLNLMGMWFPALRANNEPYTYLDDQGNTVTGIPYYDETGALIRTATEAKPIVVTYTDGVEETGKEDIFVAISRDDGNTFKRMNVSRAADKSSFILENGEAYYGEAKKPVIGVQDNNILVAWTSKYCRGGKPTYAIELLDDDPETEDYIYDDPYYEEDIWGVAGPQRSVDYSEDFPEVGEVPYSCVWVARGTIVTQEMIDAGGFWASTNAEGEPNFTVGQIQWFKPERLTSGRRDANQVFLGSASGAGFAIAWQEDPEGLQPGQAKGPGPGWGGATTSHKTDIWYSYIAMEDFTVVDENFVSGGDPVHEDPDIIGRPKALVPMALPIRLTDNDVVNTDNLMVELGADGLPVTDPTTGEWIPISKDVEGSGDGTGTHAYGYEIDGLCESFYEKVNEQGETKHICITADNRLLDGNTGASRPNLFLQKYKKADGSFSAWAIMAYDESKGVGSGPPEDPGSSSNSDAYIAESGKLSIYHSFDFQNPDRVSAGNIINLPEKEYEVDAEGNPILDADGNVNILSNITYIVDETGAQILDWQGQPQINYENARRPRFIIQGKNAIGASRTIMLILYKEGEEGSGRPSDIMLRRMVVPAGQTGNPYRFENLVCTATEVAANGETVCVGGAQNMSGTTPTVTTPSTGEPTTEDPYGAIKVVEWEQTAANLAHPSGVNHYEDARAHRGALRGDFIVMGYSYTPNWAAWRNGNDKYDFFVRRSFDGGLTWTTDPNGVLNYDIGINELGDPIPVRVEDGAGAYSVVNCDTFTDPTQEDPDGSGHLKYTVCTGYTPGQCEQARNVSQLPNSKSSVIEPRIVAPPGTITLPNGDPTGHPEDINNPNMFYLSYGTSTNPPQVHGNNSDEEEEEAAPMDLYYSFSLDRGETFVEVAWDVNPDSQGNYAGMTVYRWDYLAKGDPEQGEAQLRMTPDGSRFYATWLEDAEDGSDIWFRRIMSPEFPCNVVPTATP